MQFTFSCSRYTFRPKVIDSTPIPVAAWSKAWVCGHLLAGIVGSNPAWAWMLVVSIVGSNPAWAWMLVVSVVRCQVEVSATN